MDNTKSGNLPDLTQTCTFTVQNPFCIEGSDGVTFCREPRDASERQLQLRILARTSSGELLVPPKLRPLKRWICWKLALKDNWQKITDGSLFDKIPHSPLDGRRLDVKDNEHFVTFDEARTASKKYGLNGPGFVLVDGDGLVGIDLDHVASGGELHSSVDTFLKNWFSNTYYEWSVSGRGIHILVEGKIARALGGSIPGMVGSVELYTDKRFLTFSACRLSQQLDVGNGQEGIEVIWKAITGEKSTNSRKGRPSFGPMTAEQVRAIYAKYLSDFRAMTRTDDFQNQQLNLSAWFAAKASGALGKTEVELKRELLAIAKLTEHCPSIPGTLRSGWNAGLRDGALTIITSEQAHDDALTRIDALVQGNDEVTDPEASLNDLAALTAEEYEPRRKAAASRLKFRPTELDHAVERRRKRRADDQQLQGKAIELIQVEPWSEPVDIAQLLDEIVRLLRRFVVFKNSTDADMVALWIVFTYCYELFNIAPQIGVKAIAKESGKTTLLRLLYYLVFHGMTSINLTTAVTFRIIDLYHPVLLADEMDKWLQQNPELLAVFLSGHERDFSNVPRCVGDDNETRVFNCFGPKAWGQIGLPDDQLVSRSHIVELWRKKASDAVESWPRIGKPPELYQLLERLRSQSLRWTIDNREAIERCQVPDVSSLANRNQDNWFPLFVIAELAGDIWKRRIRDAAKVTYEVPEDELATFLRSVRNVFHTRKVDRIPSQLLWCDLMQQQDTPWPKYRQQHDGLTFNQFSGLMRQLGQKTKRLRVDKQMRLDNTKNNLNVYVLENLKEMFERYFTPDDEPEVVAITKFIEQG